MSVRTIPFAFVLLLAAALSFGQTSGQPTSDQDYSANPAAPPQAGVVMPYPVYTAPQTVNNPAYQAGFQDGVADGQSDRQANVEFRPTHTEKFDDAPGYNKSFGDRELYKHTYRDGYIAGYQQGYNAQVVYVPPAYGHPGYPAYPPQYANSPASTRGFQDGLTDGRQDRQGGVGFRETTTQNFEHTPGYDRSFGEKNVYKQLYRDAYIAGYQQSYNGLIAQPYAVAAPVAPVYAVPVYGAPQYANNAAYQRGLHDGLADGMHDRQKHQEYRPTHTDRYDDTPGYDRAFGDKDSYKRLYREAYVLGYQQGYNAR